MIEVLLFIIGGVVGFWIHGQLSKLYLRHLLSSYSQDDILHIVKSELPIPTEPEDSVELNHVVVENTHYFYLSSGKTESFVFQAGSLGEAGVTFNKLYPDRIGLFRHQQNLDYYRFQNGKYKKVSDTVYA